MFETTGHGVERVLRAYFRAKDENRPHLMKEAFSETATLETVVKTGAISFPPVSRGLDPITDVLVRKFAQSYENIYSFYLVKPPQDPLTDFTCDWLVGMSEKDGGRPRVGCGRYDWHFEPGETRLADRLVITIETMQVLAADRLDTVLQWLTGLPYPWCPARKVLETAPPIAGLDPVFKYIGRRDTI